MAGMRCWDGGELVIPREHSIRVLQGRGKRKPFRNWMRVWRAEKFMPWTAQCKGWCPAVIQGVPAAAGMSGWGGAGRKRLAWHSCCGCSVPPQPFAVLWDVLLEHFVCAAALGWFSGREPCVHFVICSGEKSSGWPFSGDASSLMAGTGVW